MNLTPDSPLAAMLKGEREVLDFRALSVPTFSMFNVKGRVQGLGFYQNQCFQVTWDQAVFKVILNNDGILLLPTSSLISFPF